MAARIASLHCYPLKSARGIDLQEAQLTPAGIAHDRRWMVTAPTGRFLTQREEPRLALIRPRLADGDLILECASQPSLRISGEAGETPVPVMVWNDACPAFDAGDEPARWLQTLLKRECRLVRYDSRHRRLSATEWTGGIEAENQFSDGFPVLIIGSASLADLNARMSRALPMNRFRPNIVVDGLDAYAEDRIDELSGGDLRLRLVKPCTRCRITATDQDSAVPDGEEPLRTLKSYRYDAQLRGVTFGQNAIVIAGSGTRIRCGQSLQVRWKA